MRRNILIATVIIAAMMELVDTSIVNVALSHMSGNLGATLEDMSWVITAYAIANVIIIPLTSFLAILLGRRNYYIGSIIAFTVCSFLCGQATNIWMLIAFRFLQGLGGGALLSVSQAIIFELFPKEKHSLAAALFGIGVFIGPTIGPTLGGFITEYYSWPWIFFINVPIGIIVSILCYFLLREPPVKQTAGKIDVLGILLLAVGIGALQTFLERGEIEDWFDTPYIIYLFFIAVFGLFFFVWRQLTIPNPVVNLRVLKSSSLSMAAILTFVTGIGLFSSVYLTPVFAQQLLHFTPSQTGLLLLPGALLAVFALMVSATLMQKGVPPVYLITTGFLLFALFSWEMGNQNLDTSGFSIMAILILRAVGLAIITVPLTSVAVSTLQPKDIPQGAALNNMMRQLGGSVGLALVNTYLAHSVAFHRSDLVSRITSDNDASVHRLQSYTNYFMGKGASLNIAHQQSIGLLDRIINQQARALSFNDTYLVVGAVFLFTLPLLLLTPKRKKSAPIKVILSDH